MCDFSEYGGPSEEWLAVEKTLPSLTFDLTQDPVALQKIVNEGREQVSAKEMETLAPGVRIQSHSIPTRDGSSIEARSYRPASIQASVKLPLFLYFHGGGFLFGTVGSEDATSAKIALKTGIVVLNVNYRHTPDHVFPTAWYDSQDSYAWLHKNIDLLGCDPEKVVVGGISAGGQLTAALTLEKHLGKALSGFPDPAGQILIIPCVAHPDTYADGPGKKLKSPEISSYVENENAPILPERVIRFFVNLLKAGTPELKDTKLNQVNATPEEVKGLCPTVFGIAGLDPLRDEGLLYAKLLTEADVPTEVSLFKGVPHGFRRFGSQLKACEAHDEVIVEGIKWTLSKPKASRKFEVKVR